MTISNHAPATWNSKESAYFMESIRNNEKKTVLDVKERMDIKMNFERRKSSQQYSYLNRFGGGGSMEKKLTPSTSKEYKMRKNWRSAVVKSKENDTAKDKTVISVNGKKTLPPLDKKEKDTASKAKSSRDLECKRVEEKLETSNQPSYDKTDSPSSFSQERMKYKDHIDDILALEQLIDDVENIDKEVFKTSIRKTNKQTDRRNTDKDTIGKLKKNKYSENEHDFSSDSFEKLVGDLLSGLCGNNSECEEKESEDNKDEKKLITSVHSNVHNKERNKDMQVSMSNGYNAEVRDSRLDSVVSEETDEDSDSSLSLTDDSEHSDNRDSVFELSDEVTNNNMSSK